MDRDTPQSLIEYYTSMTAEQLAKQYWVTQSSVDPEDLEVTKTGVHLLAQAAPELDQSNREWIMDIKGTPTVVPAFQSAMFENGLHLVSRYHALPRSAQKKFRGFYKAIMQDFLKWLTPDESDTHHAMFLEAMRQAAEAYKHFKTPSYTSHMATKSNIIQHTYDVAKSHYAAGAPSQNGTVIALIWLTRWMKEAITTHSLEAYALTGVPPTLDNLKGNDSLKTFTMSTYEKQSNAYTHKMDEKKRSLYKDAGSLHRVDLSKVCALTTQPRSSPTTQPSASHTILNQSTVDLTHNTRLSTLSLSPHPHPSPADKPLNLPNVVTQKMFNNLTKITVDIAHNTRVTFDTNNAQESDPTHLHFMQGLSPNDKNKDKNQKKITDPQSPPPDPASRYSKLTQLTPAIRILTARDAQVSLLVSHPSQAPPKPLNHPNTVTRKLFDILPLQTQEAATREAHMLKLSTDLAESREESTQTCSQLQSLTDLLDVKVTELTEMTQQYEEMCQLKATSDHEKEEAQTANTQTGVLLGAALAEKGAALRDKELAAQELNTLTQRMSKETDEMNEKIDKLQRKEWTAPKAVDRLQVTIDTQGQTIASLKNQLEQAKGYREEIKELRTVLNTTNLQKPGEKEPSNINGSLSQELSELQKDYAELEDSSNNDLADFQAELAKQDELRIKMQQVISEKSEARTELNQTIAKLQQEIVDQKAEMAMRPQKLHMTAPAGTPATSPYELQRPRSRAAAAQVDTSAAQNQAQASTTKSDQAADGESALEKIKSDYSFYTTSEEDQSQSVYQELTIDEVSTQLRKCKEAMEANIIDQKVRLKLGPSEKMSTSQKQNASTQYAEEMQSCIELWHACMSDYCQKYIAWGHRRHGGSSIQGKKKMNCCGCGVVQGDWKHNHAKADSKNSRTCTSLGMKCVTCQKFNISEQDGAERYFQHTSDACPLNNMDAFFKKLDAELENKHVDTSLTNSNTSAWS